MVAFIWSISHLTLSSSSSQTQQPLRVLPRSTKTSAAGTCQVWRPWRPVSLSLPIIDSGGSLLFYLVHFTSDPFFFLLPKNPAFNGAQMFNADLSKWDVSQSRMGGSKSFLAIVDIDSCGPWLFLFGPFHILTFFFDFQTQQPLMVAPLSMYASLRSFKDFSWRRRR